MLFFGIHKYVARVKSQLNKSPTQHIQDDKVPQDNLPCR